MRSASSRHEDYVYRGGAWWISEGHMTVARYGFFSASRPVQDVSVRIARRVS